MKIKWHLTCIALFVCACASTPTANYYTFSVGPSGRAHVEANLNVERFQTTEALSRGQIMIHASATEIEYYATERWAGSLGELVQQKLTVEFGEPVEGRKSYTVSGMVLACEQVDGPSGTEARMRLQIVVRDSESRRYQPPTHEKTYSVTRTAARPAAPAVVEALSRCLEDIAVQIADDVAGL